MAGRKISGIFVPIQLDTSNVQKDMEGLNRELGTVINSIQKKFDGALNTKNLADGVVRVTRAFGELRDSANALGKLDSFTAFKSNIDSLSPALRSLSQAFGGTVAQQKELFTQLVKTQAIDQQVKALQTLQRALKMTEQETVNLAKSRGLNISDAALKAFVPAEIIPASRFKQLADQLRSQYREAARSAGTEGRKELENAFVKEGILKTVYGDIQKIASGTGVAKDAMEAFFASIGKGSLYSKFNPIQQIKKDIEALPRVLSGASDSWRRYSELTYTSGFKDSAGMFGKYEQSLRDDAAVRAAKELGSVLGLSNKELRAQAEAAGFSKEMMDKLIPTTTALKDITRELSRSSQEYQRLSRLSGTAPSESGFQKFLDTNRIKESVDAFKQLHGTQKLTSENYAQIAKAAGVSTQQVSSYLAKNISQLRDITTELSRTSMEYQKLTRLSGTAASESGFQKFLDVRNIRNSISAFEQLNVGQKVTARNYEQIAKAAGVSAAQVAEYVKQSQKVQGRGLAGILSPSSLSAGAQSGAAALGVSFGAYGIIELTKSAYQASMRMENLNLAFESVYGSSAKAKAQLEFVRTVTDDLGLSFEATAGSAKTFYAATKGTVVEKDANQIFKAFSSMAAALKLTGEETDSVFLAISQMVSKGKVSAEELRLQLAERMPGAVTLFAKSIGVTTKELDDMLQKGQVGLEALRKFAVEVQNTYAAGAAGASTGLQAELNRVANAWFFLKQAFVSTEGSADSLRTLTSAIKLLTDLAPAISATGSYLVKFGVSAAAVAVTLKALSAAAGLSVSSFATLGATLRAHPVFALATVLSAVAAAVWEVSSSQPNAMRAIEGLSYAFDGAKTSAGGMADQVDRLNASVKALELRNAENLAKVAMQRFQAAAGPSQQTVDDPFAGGATYAGPSAFSSSLDALKRGMSSSQKELVSQGQQLGEQVRAAFLDAINSGAEGKDVKALLDSFALRFQDLRNQMELSGVSKETADAFLGLASNMLGAANAADSAKRAFESAASGVATAQNTLDSFAVAYDALRKVSQGSDEGKALKAEENINAMARSLVAMNTAIEGSRARMAELGQRTAENASEWDKHVDALRKNDTAFNLLGSTAIKEKLNLEVMSKAIEAAGLAAGLSAEKIRQLQEQAKQGFQFGGAQTVESVVSDLQTERLMAGASAGTKRAFNILKSYAKEASDELSLARALIKGSMTDIEAALKNPAVTSEGLTRIIEEAKKTAAVMDSAAGEKKGKANWEAINTAIQGASKALETWQAKVDESKADQFAATMRAEIEQIDKALRSNKGTREQIAQLNELKTKLEEVGNLRVEQIKKEQAEEERKKALEQARAELAARRELVRTGTRVTTAFKNLEGVDNYEVFAAAQQQYELDVEYFQKALDEKRISQEQFNAYMKMLNANLADAGLRSQTDMYSRIQVATDDYYRKYSDFGKNFGGVITEAADSSAKAIAAFAVSGAKDFKSLASAFDAMANQMLSTATQLFAQQAIASLMKGAMGWFGGTELSMTSDAKADTLPNANGNAFIGSSLSKYSGSVVSSPTLFRMGTRIPAYATGAGLMGEAGPEGIFPLVRKGGKLGIRAEQSASAAPTLNQSINVNVQNNTSAQVKTQESRDNQGNVSIDVMIEEMVGTAMKRPGSAPYKALQTMGGKAPLASR